MSFLREQLKDVFIVFYQKTKKWDALCVFALVFSMFSSLALQCSHGWFLSPRVLHSLVETDMLPCCIFLVWGNCYPLELEWTFPLFTFFIFCILLSFSPLPLQHRFASARIFCFFFCGIFKSQVKDEKSFQKYPSQIFSNCSFELNFLSETINSIHWTDQIMLTLFWNERKSDLPLHLRWIEMKDLWYTALLFSHIGPKDVLQFFLQEMHYNFHANQTKPKGRKDDLVSWMSYVLRWYNFSS